MKKSFSFIFMGLVSMLAAISTVHAADTAYIKCDDEKIGVGQSTNCSVYANIADTTTATSFIAGIETSKYLAISKITPNTGWTVDATNTNTSDITKLSYAFTFDATKSTLTANKDFAIFSFTLTLTKDAANITEGECGRLCLYSARFGTGGTIVNNSSCYSPTIPDTPAPETGAFTNYAILGASAFVALIAILAVNKNKKFYRV